MNSTMTFYISKFFDNYCELVDTKEFNNTLVPIPKDQATIYPPIMYNV